MLWWFTGSLWCGSEQQLQEATSRILPLPLSPLPLSPLPSIREWVNQGSNRWLTHVLSGDGLRRGRGYIYSYILWSKQKESYHSRCRNRSDKNPSHSQALIVHIDAFSRLPVNAWHFRLVTHLFGNSPLWRGSALLSLPGRRPTPRASNCNTGKLAQYS